LDFEKYILKVCTVLETNLSEQSLTVQNTFGSGRVMLGQMGTELLSEVVSCSF